MTNITLSISAPVKEEANELSWVNWSKLISFESNKKRIFEEFMSTGELSKEDQKFCDDIDWYPVDELPLKESFIKELKRIERGEHTKPMTSKEFKEWCDKL